MQHVTWDLVWKTLIPRETVCARYHSQQLRGIINDVIMSVMASLITGISIVYSTVYSSTDQFTWWLVNNSHKGPITWKMFPFDHVIMIGSHFISDISILLCFICITKIFSNSISLLVDISETQKLKKKYQHESYCLLLQNLSCVFLWQGTKRFYPCVPGSFRWHWKSICMMTSSNGNIFRVTGLLAGNSPVPGEFPAQRPVMRSFDVFFDLHLNKLLSKQSWGWWFEMLPCPLWRHSNGLPKWQRSNPIA